MSAVAAALIAFAAGAGTAHAESSASLALARGILSGLGMESEIEAIADAAIAYLAAHPERVAPAHREPLQAIVYAGFQPETLYALTLDAFLEHYEPHHAAAAAAWLERPATRRLLQRGRTRDLTAGCRLRTPLHRWGRVRSAERFSLAARVGRETSTSARAVQRASLLFGSMLVAGNAARPEAERFTRREIEQMITAQRAHLAAEYSTDPRALACAYRGVDLETLREAARFLDGESGRWMLQAVDTALERALLLAAEATAAQIVQTFGEQAQPSPQLRSARAPLSDPRAAPLPGAQASVGGSTRSPHAPDALPARRP